MDGTELQREKLGLCFTLIRHLIKYYIYKYIYKIIYIYTLLFVGTLGKCSSATVSVGRCCRTEDEAAPPATTPPVGAGESQAWDALPGVHS